MPITTTNRSLTGTSLPNVFDDILKPWISNTAWGKILNMPAVNITENEEGYKLSLAIPGVSKDNLSIEIEGDIITISAESEEDTEDIQDNYTHQEYNYSSFSRSFTLPDEVNSDAIEATFNDGVLTVLLPKVTTGTKNSQSIPIK